MDSVLNCIDLNIGSLVMDQITQNYEWTGSDDPNDKSGTAKFIQGGMFGRPVKLESIEDCQYIADMLDLSFKAGYVNGKDRIKHRLGQIMNEKDDVIR